MSFKLTSSSFDHNDLLPSEFTIKGKNVSPDLKWEEAPENTRSFALIMEDPDATDGTFTHWVIYNLPADLKRLNKNIPFNKYLKNGIIQGKNDFGKYGYIGPNPPGEDEHRYYIRLFALKKKLPPNVVKNGSDLHNAIKGLVLDTALLTGRYKR